MQQLKYIKLWIACLALCATFSCGKEHFNYEHFIRNGPIVYPGRADSVVALAGKERMLLSWAVPSDLNITGYKVFWNFNADSLSVPERKPAGGDSVSVYINNLPEGSHSFTVYAYDKEGHRSVGTEAIGNVYGSIFSSTIFNRPFSSLKRDTSSSALLVAWVGLDPKCIGTEWLYTGTDGLTTSFFSPIGDSTIITSCDVAQSISYRSFFLPEPNAIDTFYTAFKSL